MVNASHTEKAGNAVEEPTDAQIEAWVQAAIDLFPGVAMRNKERERALARWAFELGWSNGLKDGLAQGHAKRPVRQHVAKALAGLMRARFCGGGDMDQAGLSLGASDTTGAWHGHYWLEVRDPEGATWIVDATSDQFGWPPVTVGLADNLAHRYRKEDPAISRRVLKDVMESIANFPNG